ncbi:MAG: prenyltransferase [Pseudomonadota bacterium]
MLRTPMQTLEDRNHLDGTASSNERAPGSDRGSSSDPSGVFARLRPWVQAARPIAHPMIFVPLLIGQAFAFDNSGQFNGTLFLCALLFGALYQIYLLYTNDHADAAIDATNQQYWLSGGSRVLPEGKLTAAQLLNGARITLLVLVAFTVFLAVAAQRPLMPALLLIAVALCWGYNRKPLQLSYRGYGEVLQGLGCGVLLPLIGFYLQSGALDSFPWAAVIPLYLVFHAGNLVTALPDYASDKAGGKCTFPVRRGELAARWTAVLLLGVAYASLFFMAPTLSTAAVGVVVGPAALILVGLIVSGLIRRADVSAFSQCKAFVNGVSASQAWFLCAWVGAVFLAGAA